MAYKVLNRVTNTAYKGLKKIGSLAMKPVDTVLKRMENVDNERMTRDIKMINDNFGSVDNYLKLQEEKKKKLK